MMKSIKLEWCLGEIKNAHTLLQEAVKHYPDFAKVSVERKKEKEREREKKRDVNSYENSLIST